MPLRDWFEQRQKQKQAALSPTIGNDRISEEDIEKLWKQCYQCEERLPAKEIEANQKVCPKCGYHFRVTAGERIEQLFDSFTEINPDLHATDPLKFSDLEPCQKRIGSAERKTGKKEAITTGRAKIMDIELAAAIMDFDFMGGSMGSVVGEKLTRLIEYALEAQLPLLIVTASGGARMREGIFGLMQMVKTGAALAKLHEVGLLYITLLSEPTFGGVTASFGTLGDIVIAEEGARIGFAGRRVIEQTIRQKLPPEFQTADYLKQYGQVDKVASRTQLKETLYQILRLHQRALSLAGSYDKRKLG